MLLQKRLQQKLNQFILIKCSKLLLFFLFSAFKKKKKLLNFFIFFIHSPLHPASLVTSPSPNLHSLCGSCIEGERSLILKSVQYVKILHNGALMKCGKNGTTKDMKNLICLFINLLKLQDLINFVQTFQKKISNISMFISRGGPLD